MLMVVGTVPDETIPMVRGLVSLRNGNILVDGHKVDVDRGTGALLAAALKVTNSLGGQTEVQACLAGDIGLGGGSRNIYRFLEAHVAELGPTVLAFHYLQPDIDWQNRILFAVQGMEQRPLLVADAGYMYAAKAGGQAPEYDLFTPDVGELAFLADENAPHPFYTRGFILHQEDRVEELASRAYEHGNAARFLLIKGKTDFVAHSRGVMHMVREPDIPNLEPIGGTGDTITGMVSALMACGLETSEAALVALRANREAGRLADPSPATTISEIVTHLPEALERVLSL